MKCELGTLASVKGGKRLPKGRSLISIPNTHPYIRVRDLSNQRTLELNSSFEFVDDETQKQIARYIVQKGDIILSIVGTIGLVAIVGKSLDNANLTENCVKIVASDKIDNKFLYYYLMSPLGQAEIKRGTVGAVQAKLPIKNIQNIDVWLPEKKIQIKIASVLSALDDKIECNNKINENLQQQAQAIYHNMFVENAESEWQYGLLGDIASITNGKRPPMKQVYATADVNVPLVGAASVMGYTNTILYSEPILVTGRVGTHGVIQRFQSPCWPSDNTLVIKSSLYEYVYQILRCVDYSSMNRGSTQPLITQKDLKNVPVVLPPRELVYEFERIAGTLMKKYKANHEENEKLANLRDTLLPKLMLGELDISSIRL